MAPSPARIGMCFHRTLPPPLVTDLARRLEEGGADQLWVVEDCFYTAGISLAASALAVTERLEVGVGILPAVARNPAITAMEIATLAELAPGRLLAGIGHGVQSWMEQMGSRTPSPLTSLEEVLSVVQRLLAGERVSVDGRFVHLDEVELDQPPAEPPPILAGVRGPRSLALAGRAADGVVLAEPAGPAVVRRALEQAERQAESFHVAAYAAVCVEDDRATAYQRMAPWLAGLLDVPTPELRALPFFDELVGRHATQGVDGLVTMPPEWWMTLGPIGTLDDARAHVAALEEAGARSIGLFPVGDPSGTMAQLPAALALAHR